MKLASYLARHGISHRAFAALIGTSQVAVSRYASGQRMPRREILRTIVEATDGEVSASDSLDPTPGALAPDPEPAVGFTGPAASDADGKRPLAREGAGR